MFELLTVVSTNQGAGVKLSEPGKDASGGLVTNVTWKDYSIEAPRYASMYTNVFTEDAAFCALPRNVTLKNWLTVQGATFRNVTATVGQGQAAGCFLFTPDRPGMDYVFDGVVVREQKTGSAAKGYECFNTKNFVGLEGSVPSPCK